MRAIKHSDYAAICRMIDATEVGIDNMRASEEPFDRPEVRQWYERLHVSGDCHGIISEDKDGIVAVALCINDTRALTTRHVGYVSVVVREDMWGQGLGRTHVAELLNLCRNEVYLAEILHTNNASIALFKSLGFNEYGHVPMAVIKREKQFDTMILGRFSPTENIAIYKPEQTTK